jgi:hypothetical protein
MPTPATPCWSSVARAGRVLAREHLVRRRAGHRDETRLRKLRERVGELAGVRILVTIRGSLQPHRILDRLLRIVDLHHPHPAPGVVLVLGRAAHPGRRTSVRTPLACRRIASSPTLAGDDGARPPSGAGFGTAPQADRRTPRYRPSACREAGRVVVAHASDSAGSRPPAAAVAARGDRLRAPPAAGARPAASHAVSARGAAARRQRFAAGRPAGRRAARAARRRRAVRPPRLGEQEQVAHSGRHWRQEVRRAARRAQPPARRQQPVASQSVASRPAGARHDRRQPDPLAVGGGARDALEEVAGTAGRGARTSSGPPAARPRRSAARRRRARP